MARRSGAASVIKKEASPPVSVTCIATLPCDAPGDGEAAPVRYPLPDGGWRIARGRRRPVGAVYSLFGSRPENAVAWCVPCVAACSGRDSSGPYAGTGFGTGSGVCFGTGFGTGSEQASKSASDPALKRAAEMAAGRKHGRFTRAGAYRDAGKKAMRYRMRRMTCGVAAPVHGARKTAWAGGVSVFRVLQIR